MSDFEKNADELKWFHTFIPVLTIPILTFFLFPYLWFFFATITERNGLWGSMYTYYNLSKLQYSIYLIIVILIIIGSIFYQLKFLLKRDVSNLNKTFKLILIFVFLVIVFTLFLEYRFVGKG